MPDKTTTLRGVWGTDGLVGNTARWEPACKLAGGTVAREPACFFGDGVGVGGSVAEWLWLLSQWAAHSSNAAAHVRAASYEVFE